MDNKLCQAGRVFMEFWQTENWLKKLYVTRMRKTAKCFNERYENKRTLKNNHWPHDVCFWTNCLVSQILSYTLTPSASPQCIIAHLFYLSE